jgi:hypothetical protein
LGFFLACDLSPAVPRSIGSAITQQRSPSPLSRQSP